MEVISGLYLMSKFPECTAMVHKSWVEGLKAGDKYPYLTRDKDGNTVYHDVDGRIREALSISRFVTVGKSLEKCLNFILIVKHTDNLMAIQAQIDDTAYAPGIFSVHLLESDRDVFGTCYEDFDKWHIMEIPKDHTILRRRNMTVDMATEQFRRILEELDAVGLDVKIHRGDLYDRHELHFYRNEGLMTIYSTNRTIDVKTGEDGSKKFTIEDHT